MMSGATHGNETLIATAQVPTPNAAKYLVQLCKHFAHKVPAEWSDTSGWADLPGGRVEMQSGLGSLEFVIRSSDVDGLEKACFIVEDHVLRFGFREKLAALAWERTSE